MTEDDRAAVIAKLNDAHRAHPGPGWVMTRGVQALGAQALAQASAAVRCFSAFDPDNDPHGEHDFGTVVVGGARLFWKIDYYDLDLCWASSDPADPALTRRVLTLMLAQEY